MRYKRLLMTGILSTAISIGSMAMVYGQDTYYKVQPGDTYWIIGQKFNVSTSKLMELNSANGNTFLYVGQNLIISKDTTTTTIQTIHKVQSGDTFWIISQKYGVDISQLMAANNATSQTILHIGDQIIIPTQTQAVNSTVYKVQSGDTYWLIGQKFKMDTLKLMEYNGHNQNTILHIGQEIKIPGSESFGEKYGEYLDWWSQANDVLPLGAEFKIIDFYTGKSFMAKRTAGTNHADVETLTLVETNKMKEIWGGSFTWVKRPVIIEYNGRRLAASAAGMPHAGNDSAPGGEYTSWRSDGYGAGYNLDWIKNNGMQGVIDLHFPNSTRHSNNTVDDVHQENIKIAAGLK